MRARGQGTLLSDGRWRVCVVRIIDGKRVKRSFAGKTQREAQAKARRWEPAKTEDPTLRQFLAEWLSSLRVTPATERSYRLAVRLVSEQIGGIRLSRLDPRHFESLQVQGSRLPSQVRTIMGTAMNYARKRRLLDWNPALLSAVPKTRKKPESPMVTPAMLESVLAVSTPPFRSYFAFLGATGLRPAKEALCLTWDDFYYDEGWWVKVRNSKTQKGIRDVPISDEMYALVEREWPWDFSYRFAVDKWHEALKKAGLPRTNLYQLRHLYATEKAMIGEREVVSASMGHGDPRLMDRYYIRIQRERLRKLVR